MPKILPKYKNRFISAAIAIAVLAILLNSPLFDSLKMLAAKVFSSPAVACRSVKQYFASKDALLKENIGLRYEIGELALENARLEDAKKENGRLRDLLSFKKNFKFDTVSACVLSRGPNDWTGSFVIDRGSSSGVKMQSAVCSAEGLLGKVVRTSADRSSVILLTHPSFRAGGVTKESRVNGVVAGEGNGRVRMLYIPMDADVSKGEVVTTSGLSRVFPKGILIGEITEVHRSRTGLYQIAEINPFAGFSDAEEVLCIVDKE